MSKYKLKTLYFVLFFLSFLLLSFPVVGYYEGYFSDDFSGDDSKWVVVRSYQWDNHSLPCMNGSIPAAWTVVDGEYGIKIQGPACVTESVPNNEFWNQAWNDYIYELDLHMVNGTDKNIAWRYTDENNWLGIHIVGPWAYFQRIIKDSHDNYQQLIDGKTYHFKIIAQGRKHEVYYYDVDTPNSVSYMLGHRDDDLYLTGKPALQASDGSPPNNFSEAYFDNIKVTSLEIPDPTPTPTPEPTPFIDLPYFSQFDIRWKGKPYDTTTKSIGDLGCALTSVAMVLKYHGIDIVPDGSGGWTPLTPLSLNKYFVANNVYDNNGQLDFPKIAEIANFLIPSLKAEGRTFDFDILEYKRFEPPNYVKVDEILSNMLFPLIFQLPRPEPIQNHFVAATQTITSAHEYGISDPLDVNRISLAMPPEQVASVRSFEPAKSDPSYLWLMTESDMTLRVITPQGDVTDDGSATPSALLSFLNPLSNANDPNDLLDNDGWEFDFKYPVSGDYLVKYRAENDGYHKMWWWFIDKKRENYDVDGVYFGGKNYENTIKLHLPMEDIGSYYIEKVVDFPTLFSDLRALRRLGWLKHHGTYMSLNSVFQVCHPFHRFRWWGFEKMLDSAIRRVERLPEKYITEEGRGILLYDLNYIADHYTPPAFKPWFGWGFWR